MAGRELNRCIRELLRPKLFADAPLQILYSSPRSGGYVISRARSSTSVLAACRVAVLVDVLRLDL